MEHKAGKLFFLWSVTLAVTLRHIKGDDIQAVLQEARQTLDFVKSSEKVIVTLSQIVRTSADTGDVAQIKQSMEQATQMLDNITLQVGRINGLSHCGELHLQQTSGVEWSKTYTSYLDLSSWAITATNQLSSFAITMGLSYTQVVSVTSKFVQDAAESTRLALERKDYRGFTVAIEHASILMKRASIAVLYAVELGSNIRWEGESGEMTYLQEIVIKIDTLYTQIVCSASTSQATYFMLKGSDGVIHADYVTVHQYTKEEVEIQKLGQDLAGNLSAIIAAADKASWSAYFATKEVLPRIDYILNRLAEWTAIAEKVDADRNQLEILVTSRRTRYQGRFRDMCKEREKTTRPVTN